MEEIEKVETIDRVLDALAALGIVGITYDLNGGGDSGECELTSVDRADGTTEHRLPDLPIGFFGDGRIRDLASFLVDYAAEFPEGDWVNNEGGSGTVTFLPQADADERVECSMSYNDEDDDDYDEDVDDIELDDDDDGEPFDPEQIDDDTPITIGKEQGA